ncbi:hypothetical protein R6Q57_022293 [Mikania cordata]
MSLQQGGQMQLMYPATETNPPSHRQSDGSFGAVFIVLGVIVVVSVIACFLGCLFKKRYNKSKPSNHGRHTKGRYMEPKRNAFQTKDGDTEFGFDKRFSSAKVAANGEPNMSPNMGPHMGRLNSFHEPNMGPNLGRSNLFHEPNMGQNLGQPNLFHEPKMDPNMDQPNLFHEQNMGRPNLFHESNMGPNLGRPNSIKEPSRGRLDSFQEPHKGRPNSFREGEYRDDQMRFGGDEDHQMNSNSGTGPQYY